MSCSHDCVNTLGSFFCSCPSGFTIDSSGLRCVGEWHTHTHTHTHNWSAGHSDCDAWRPCFKAKITGVQSKAPSKQQCRTLQVERFFRSICFDIVERTKFYNRIVRHCCRLWQQSRMLLRHCCWCGPGLSYLFRKFSWGFSCFLTRSYREHRRVVVNIRFYASSQCLFCVCVVSSLFISLCSSVVVDI